MTEDDINLAQVLLAKRQTLKALLVTLNSFTTADIQISSGGSILAKIAEVNTFTLSNYINSSLVDLQAQLGTLGVTNLTD